MGVLMPFTKGWYVFRLQKSHLLLTCHRKELNRLVGIIFDIKHSRLGEGWDLLQEVGQLQFLNWAAVNLQSVLAQNSLTLTSELAGPIQILDPELKRLFVQ